MSAVEIRLCKTWDECVQCEELQKRVWEMPDYRDVVPANILITALKNGGLLVGAFDGDSMLGFAFGFLGSESHGSDAVARHLKHTSHMLAVLPHSRIRGLGARIKWFQRAAALKQGLDLMTWTYDPLQAVNAHLNLNRLGVIARRYLRNVYGDMTDALNAGVASDRFEVEWHLDSPHVLSLAPTPEPISPSTSPGTAVSEPLYELAHDAEGLPHILDEHPLSAPSVLVEIPPDINIVKARNLPLAIRWRERTRSTFERAFQSRYIATHFLRFTDANGQARAGYVLTKDFTF